MTRGTTSSAAAVISCITVACFGLWLCLTKIQAQPRGILQASAIDAKGVQYSERDYWRGPRWMRDAIFAPKPEYPYNDRRLHHEGTALFRLTIDPKTGSTTNVAMIKSTGFPKLDDEAFNVVRRWRWRPGKWKEVGVPVVFTLTPPRA